MQALWQGKQCSYVWRRLWWLLDSNHLMPCHATFRFCNSHSLLTVIFKIQDQMSPWTPNFCKHILFSLGHLWFPHNLPEFWPELSMHLNIHSKKKKWWEYYTRWDFDFGRCGWEHYRKGLTLVKRYISESNM